MPTMDGAMIPLGQLARVSIGKGAPSIRTENALLSAYIYVDIRDRDIGSYVAEARKAVAEAGEVSARLLRHLERAVRIHGAGRCQDEDRGADHRAASFSCCCISISGALTESLIVMLSVPFALVGGVWLLWLLGYNLSVAVAVGFIALAGVAAETGVVMLIYLEHAWQEKQAALRCRRPQALPG